MSTRLDKAITGSGVLLALLVGAAALNPLLRQGGDPPASALPAITPQPVTTAASEAMLARQAAVSAREQAYQTQELAARAAALKAAPQPPAATQNPPPAPAPAPQSSGVLSCSAVEQLWVAAGGPAADEVLMAEISGAESSRDPAAPYGGLWQIQGGQPVPGNINDPMINAENAVAKFNSQGLAAWTTYTSGAYLSHPC